MWARSISESRLLHRSADEVLTTRASSWRSGPSSASRPISSSMAWSRALGGRRPRVEDDDLEQGRVTDEKGVLAERPQLARDVGHVVVPVDEPGAEPARVAARQQAEARTS